MNVSGTILGALHFFLTTDLEGRYYSHFIDEV